MVSVIDREAVCESAVILETLVDHSHDLLAYFDRGFNFVRVNRAYAESCRRRREELIGRNHFDLYPHAENQAIFERVRDTGEPTVSHEKPFVFPDQPERGVTYWNWTLTPVKDAAGFVHGLVLSLHDVTDTVRARERAHETDDRLRLFVEYAPASVAMFDRNMVCLAASRRFLSDHNVSPADVIGRCHYDVFTDLPERWKEAHRRCLAGAVESGEEGSLPRADGTLDWRRWEVHPWRTGSGEIGGLILFCEVVTERKRAEQALREANARLQETDRRKNEFLAMLSHELRNPLAPISNSLFVLNRSEPGGAQAQRALQVIERQVAHMTRMVEDLLDVSRISHGRLQLRRQRVELHSLLRGVAEDHRATFENGGVALELRLCLMGEPLFVDCDPTRLAQVVGNLLANAAKFTPAGGHTWLSTETDGEAWVVIRVRDDGRGMEPEMIDHLFEPFVQATQALDRSTGGLGLGLAMVKGLVELHGGTVAALSEGDGRGAELVVRLPLSEHAQPASSDSRFARHSPGARRVLVIEDNTDSAQSLKEVLELGGHVVALAYAGDEGIEMLSSFRPDIVLCDIGLPGLDGYEVVKRLRAQQRWASLHLVALTGYAGPEDVERARCAGFDHHLAKPVDVVQLTKVLATWRSNGTSVG